MKAQATRTLQKAISEAARRFPTETIKTLKILIKAAIKSAEGAGASAEAVAVCDELRLALDATRFRAPMSDALAVAIERLEQLAAELERREQVAQVAAEGAPVGMRRAIAADIYCGATLYLSAAEPVAVAECLAPGQFAATITATDYPFVMLVCEAARYFVTKLPERIRAWRTVSGDLETAFATWGGRWFRSAPKPEGDRFADFAQWQEVAPARVPAIKQFMGHYVPMGSLVSCLLNIASPERWELAGNGARNEIIDARVYA